MWVWVPGEKGWVEEPDSGKAHIPRIKWRRTWPISHFFNPILPCSRSEFQGRKDELMNQNLEELATLKNQMKEIWTVSHFFKPYLTCTRSEFQRRKDEVRNWNLKGLTTLKNNMEENMDNLSLLYPCFTLHQVWVPGEEGWGEEPEPGGAYHSK